MKILHSSDLHLNKHHPERIGALDRILEVARERRADALLIAGDFFDSKADSDYFRPKLRQKFNGLGFKVYLIPGNHDYGSFEGDLFFGNQLGVLNRRPFQSIDLGLVQLVAVPYYNQDFNRYALDIAEAKADKVNILLLHCSLDAPFLSEDEFGPEQGEGYLPVATKVLAGLGFDYVLAGHYHSRFLVHNISERCFFVYSGSPVSITNKEIGPRALTFLDTEKREIASVPLKTRYYDRLELMLEPGKEQETLNTLKVKIKEHDPANAFLEVVFDGFTSRGEKKLKQEIDRILAGLKEYNLDTVYRYRDIADLLADPAYIGFSKKLKQKNLEKKLEKEIEMTFRTLFSRLKYQG